MKYIIALMFFQVSILAQSEFIPNSIYGVKADYVYAYNKEVSGMGGDIGISLLSVVDIGFEYFKGSGTSDDNVKSAGGLVYAAYNLRVNENYLKFLLGYSKSVIKIIGYQGYVRNIDVTGPIFGVLYSPKVYENQSICLLPGFKFSMSILSETEKGNYSYFSSSGDNVYIGFEFNVIPKINEKFYLVLTPSVSKSFAKSGVPATYGIGVGLLYNVPRP